jgi:hypothetical protein
MDLKVASFLASESNTERKLSCDYLVIATGTKQDLLIVPKASTR